VIVAHGADRLSAVIDGVRAAGRVENAFATSDENDLTIWALHRPRAPMTEMGIAVKHYD
jgi:hypothetical protein